MSQLRGLCRLAALMLCGMLIWGCAAPSGQYQERTNVVGEREDASAELSWPLQSNSRQSDAGDINPNVYEPSRQP
jgi:hypothetical protein